MAKLEQGILGPFRGKVGTVVGYLWRGKHVVRAYRREINYPNTERQQAEREWFVGMVRFAATARQALLLGLREIAAREQMTEGNVFVRMNKGCFGRESACGVRSGMAPLRPAATSPCEGEERENAVRSQISRPFGCSSLHGEFSGGVRGGVDYERIRIAEGAAAPVRFTGAVVDEEGVLRVEYEKNSGMTRAKASDHVYLYVYNIDTREGLLSAATERRRGHLAMQLPEGWDAQSATVYGFTVDADGRASMSSYIALTEDVERSDREGLASGDVFGEFAGKDCERGGEVFVFDDDAAGDVDVRGGEIPDGADAVGDHQVGHGLGMG